MNISLQRQNRGFFSFYSSHGLKSTEEKQERQMQCEQEVGFWEDRKENLKTMKCNTLEEIARKLELFHSYEEEINAVKMAYNNEQMWHIMDEAKEIGEKIAEAAEKAEPKTPEEREEERRKEALDTEEEQGTTSELLEDMEESLTEEELIEKTEENLEEQVAEQEYSLEEKQDFITEEEWEKTLWLERQRLQIEKRMIREESIIGDRERFDIRV